MPKPFRAALVFIALWLLIGIAVSWPAMQDDALIHLRYATHLLHQHMLSYDGVHTSYGASSLLYIALLAFLRTFTTSPLLPRAVSSLSHLLLFAGLAVAFARSLRNAPRVAWLFAILLLASIATPSAIRWLDDGMETPLVLLFTAALAFAVARLARSKDFPASSALALAFLGFFTVFLRVELLLLVSIGSLVLFLARRALSPQHIARSAAPVLGGLLAAALMFALTHSLLPDTALAKSFGPGAWYVAFYSTGNAFVSAMSHGLVPLFLWLLSLATLLAILRRLPLATLAANSLFPITVALALSRGQSVQGVRYFLWTLLFPILWNILELRNLPPHSRSLRVPTFAAYTLAALLVLAQPLEAKLFNREFRARAQMLEQFRSQHLDRLQSLPLVAFDIGYIGYFTQSPICDMAGLVNGRAAARLSYAERVTQCATQHPGVAFGSQGQLDDLNARLDLSRWSICAIYDYADLRHAERHYLVAPPENTAAVCAAAGSAPQPLTPLLLPPSDPALLTR